ncbi:MAG: NADH-quinone oxidoreductase subunit H [Deltaproteobacteria bacterium]|nr:NADH-quinone oxidoreductase subunit H [Deltaproteobacteria bacterium]
MLLGIGFKVILVSTVLLGVLVPSRARMLAVRGAPLEIRDGVFANHPVIGLIRPLAWLLDLLIDRAGTTSASERRLTNIATSLAFVALLSAFAVIPFGSRYRLGEREIALVVADLDWGILWLLGAAMLALFGAIGSVRKASRRVPLAIEGASYALGAGLALAALAMVFGTLNPTTMVVAQDQNFLLVDFVGPALPALQRLQLPAWGVFFQPVSLLLFVFCALGASRAPLSESQIEPGPHDSGATQLLVRVADHLGSLLVAGVIVVLFFGGGALPYVAGDTIIRIIGDYFGTGLATILCMAIHTSVFFAKLMLVTIAIEPLRLRLARLSFEATLNRCWKGIIPLAVVNLFVTAEVVLASITP